VNVLSFFFLGVLVEAEAGISVRRIMTSDIGISAAIRTIGDEIATAL